MSLPGAHPFMCVLPVTVGQVMKASHNEVCKKPCRQSVGGLVGGWPAGAPSSLVLHRLATVATFFCYAALVSLAVLIPGRNRFNCGHSSRPFS